MSNFEGYANPYPGLRPFAQDESHLFFGRERNIDELLGHFRRHRFLAVLGASGTGKSSLVHAGLLPHLEGGFATASGSRWSVVSLKPGADPIGNLARALHTPRCVDDAVLKVAGAQPPGESEADIECLDAASSRRMLRSRLAEAETLHELSRLEQELGPADEEHPELGLLEAGFTEATLRRSRRGLVRVAEELGLGQDGNLLILVDQFEELFRFAEQRGDRRRDDASAFVNLLLESTLDPQDLAQPQGHIYVLITMRSYFLGRCVRFSGLPEAINRGQYLVPRLDRMQMEQAICGPARVGGTSVGKELLQQLLVDIDIEHDQLPILQHALMRTYAIWSEDQARGDSRDAPAISWVDYARSGGLGEALSRHAEEAYAEFESRDPDHARICCAVFSALTDMLDGSGVRRPCTVAHLATIAGCDEASVRQLVEVFREKGRAFLMPPIGVDLESKTVIDISHESLMRVWTRLRGWVSDNARDAEFYRRLVQAAELHRLGEAGLWRMPELAVASSWRERVRPNAAWAARFIGDFELAMRFLDESWTGHLREQAEREQAELSAARQAQALAEADRDRQAAESKARWEVLKRYMVIVAGLGIGYVAWSAWSIAETGDSCDAPNACLDPAKIAANFDRAPPVCEPCVRPPVRDCADEARQCAQLGDPDQKAPASSQRELCSAVDDYVRPLEEQIDKLRSKRDRQQRTHNEQSAELEKLRSELAHEREQREELKARLAHAQGQIEREIAASKTKVRQAKLAGEALARFILQSESSQACRWLRHGRADYLRTHQKPNAAELVQHITDLARP